MIGSIIGVLWIFVFAFSTIYFGRRHWFSSFALMMRHIFFYDVLVQQSDLFITKGFECVEDVTQEWVHIHYSCEFIAFAVELILVLKTQMDTKDAPILVAHHVVTLFLLVASLQLDHTPVGLTVLVMHHTGDVLLYFSETVHYFRLQGYTVLDSGLRSLEKIVFTVFAIIFFYTRFMGLGVDIMMYGCAPRADSWIMKATLAVLSSLVLMHAIWFYYIIKMLRRMWNNNHQDVRR